MAMFMEDTKNKIQDLFVYLVSCGKSSKEPSRNDQEARDDLGLKIYMPEENQAGPEAPVPARTADDQVHVVEPGNNTQNPSGQATNTAPGLDESAGNAQEEDDDFEHLPDDFIPEERALFSRPPGKRSAPTPKTG